MTPTCGPGSERSRGRQGTGPSRRREKEKKDGGERPCSARPFFPPLSRRRHFARLRQAVGTRSLREMAPAGLGDAAGALRGSGDPAPSRPAAPTASQNESGWKRPPTSANPARDRAHRASPTMARSARPAFNTSSDRDSTASLASPFQCLINLPGRNSSNVQLTSPGTSSDCPLKPVPYSWKQIPIPAWLHPPVRESVE